MNWVKCEDELPADDLKVLLCDKNGHTYLGTRDEWGYSDERCNKLYDIMFWAYLPKTHSLMLNGTVTEKKQKRAL